MDYVLTDMDVRVLGCLMEKKMTTPAYYPLTMNALVNACNQKVNREPVVDYHESELHDIISSLKDKHLLWQMHSGRVLKYKERFSELEELSEADAAIICVMLLRGGQTAGEIRQRTDRMHSFENLATVTEAIENLCDRGFVTRLPRQPGRKETRYTHLLCGQPEVGEDGIVTSIDQSIDDERVKNLEEKVEVLSNELNELKEKFSEFQKQFE